MVGSKISIIKMMLLLINQNAKTTVKSFRSLRRFSLGLFKTVRYKCQIIINKNNILICLNILIQANIGQATDV